MIVSDSGDVVAPAGFHEVVEVDQTRFVKLFVDGVTAFNDLTTTGRKSFELVYKLIVKNPGADHIYLSHKDAPRMSRATFDRGILELLNKEILYKSTRPYIYYINVNYIFNGNRLALIKEYRLKSRYKPTEDGPKQQDLFDI